MALSLLLRNTIKFNGTGASTLKAFRFSPVRTYAGVIGCQRDVFINNLAQMNTVKMTQTRDFSLSQANMSSASGNHTPLWTLERIVSGAMLGVIPAALLSDSQALDTVMAVMIILHTHWGLDAVAGDYLRPNNVGAFMSKAAKIVVFIMSIVALAGLFYLIFNDIGLSRTIREFWAIKGKEEEVDDGVECFDKKGYKLDKKCMSEEELKKCYDDYEKKMEKENKKKLKEEKEAEAKRLKEEKAAEAKRIKEEKEAEAKRIKEEKEAEARRIKEQKEAEARKLQECLEEAKKQ